MVASKVICDDTYSNRSWSIVGQGMFQLREVNQMEREMCTARRDTVRDVLGEREMFQRREENQIEWEKGNEEMTKAGIPSIPISLSLIRVSILLK
jgi:hypothetical protein